MNHTASTQLWIGSSEYLQAEVFRLVQRHYCSDGCSACGICKRIQENQHHALLMVSTVKAVYSRSDLDTLFSKIAFFRSAEEPFFCIITQAEKLSAACANSLLKLLEEPPCGWHWVLLTERPQELLATVLSRCVVKEFTTQGAESSRELYAFLTAPQLGDMVSFQQMLERAKLTDYDSRLLFDQVLAFWTTRNISEQNYFQRSSFLNNLIEYQPMPGSSKFFWRTLYFVLSQLGR